MSGMWRAMSAMMRGKRNSHSIASFGTSLYSSAQCFWACKSSHPGTISPLPRFHRHASQSFAFKRPRDWLCGYVILCTVSECRHTTTSIGTPEAGRLAGARGMSNGMMQSTQHHYDSFAPACLERQKGHKRNELFVWTELMISLQIKCTPMQLAGLRQSSALSKQKARGASIVCLLRHKGSQYMITNT